MKVYFSREFIKALKKAPKRIKSAFKERLEIFVKDPSDPRLRNHPLKGKLKGYRSINITGDWRALFEEVEDGVHFVIIGTHSQLYK